MRFRFWRSFVVFEGLSGPGVHLKIETTFKRSDLLSPSISLPVNDRSDSLNRGLFCMAMTLTAYCSAN